MAAQEVKVETFKSKHAHNFTYLILYEHIFYPGTGSSKIIMSYK